MGQKSHTQSMSEMVIANQPAEPFISSRYRTALDHLRWSYMEARPLVILNGGWTVGASHVIREFLAGLNNDVVVARISRPSADATAGMRQIVRCIGGGAKDMSLADLEHTFTEFLHAQKNLARRTILIVEETPNGGRWVLDKVLRLVESEMEDEYGLMVILSRPSHVNERLVATPLGAICDQARRPHSMSPFTLAESRAFVHWRISADDDADLGEVFDVHAVTLMHHLCSGVPDALDALCCKCLWLANKVDAAPVTTDLVMKANKFLNMPHLLPRSKNTDWSDNADRERILDDNSGVPMQTAVRMTYNDAAPFETIMDRTVLTIGRCEENDLYINDNCISREHAVMIRHGNKVIVMDLDSKNGTYVNSHRVHKSFVTAQDIISVGDSRISFRDSDVGDSAAMLSDVNDNEVVINGLKNIRNIFAKNEGLESRPPTTEKSAEDSDRRLS